MVSVLSQLRTAVKLPDLSFHKLSIVYHYLINSHSLISLVTYTFRDQAHHKIRYDVSLKPINRA